eukprot:3045456-Prymnesium_polylepis.1
MLPVRGGGDDDDELDAKLSDLATSANAGEVRKLLLDSPSARVLAALLPLLWRLPNDDRDDPCSNPFPSELLTFPIAIALCKMLQLQLLPLGPASTRGSAVRSLQPIGKTLVKHFRHLLSLLFDPLATGSGCMRALALSCANQGCGVRISGLAFDWLARCEKLVRSESRASVCTCLLQDLSENFVFLADDLEVVAREYVHVAVHQGQRILAPEKDGTIVAVAIATRHRIPCGGARGTAVFSKVAAIAKSEKRSLFTQALVDPRQLDDAPMDEVHAVTLLALNSNVLVRWDKQWREHLDNRHSACRRDVLEDLDVLDERLLLLHLDGRVQVVEEEARALPNFKGDFVVRERRVQPLEVVFLCSRLLGEVCNRAGKSTNDDRIHEHAQNKDDDRKYILVGVVRLGVVAEDHEKGKVKRAHKLVDQFFK